MKATEIKIISRIANRTVIGFGERRAAMHRVSTGRYFLLDIGARPPGYRPMHKHIHAADWWSALFRCLPVLTDWWEKR